MTMDRFLVSPPVFSGVRVAHPFCFLSCVVFYLPLSCVFLGLVGWLMVFNATFNNISVISWRSVLLMEETGVPGENRHACQMMPMSLDCTFLIALSVFFNTEFLFIKV
jgi:hypothetical protein